MSLPLNIDLQQVFLHMFNFVILTGGMYFLLYKPVKDFMDKRKAYYAGLEQESREKMTQANLLKEEYEGKMAQADREISQRRADTAKEMELSRERSLAQAKKQAQDILDEARSRGEQEKEKIISKARGEIADLAAEAAEKILYSSASEAFDGFLDSAEGSVNHE